MTSRRSYLVVEGPHDVEFVGRLLKPLGFGRTKKLSELDLFWVPLVPRNFPADGEDLLKRMPIPVFFANATHSVAVQSAVGDSRLVRTVEESVKILPNETADLDGIGVLLDADGATPAAARYANIRSGLASLGLTLPDVAGGVSVSSPRCGVFVLPDNTSEGALEDLLLEAATMAYPTLLAGARSYVDGVAVGGPGFEKGELGDFDKPAGRRKATVACIANVLRPGKAVQVSIQDNRWLKGETLKLPRILAVSEFLAKLMGL